jgi:catechol 2,3-dioxygenase-like lactoylglutathione lyase family enzyme
MEVWQLQERLGIHGPSLVVARTVAQQTRRCSALIELYRANTAFGDRSLVLPSLRTGGGGGTRSDPFPMSASPTVGEIGQIALTMADVAAARRFYTEVLGLKFLFDAGPNLSFIAAGTVRIMLTTAQGHGAPGSNSTLYFKVSSAESAFAACVERGAKPERAPQLTAKMPDHELWMGFPARSGGQPDRLDGRTPLTDAQNPP